MAAPLLDTFSFQSAINQFFHSLSLCTCLFLFSNVVGAATASTTAPPATPSPARIIYQQDFRKLSGEARQTLTERGLTLKKDMLQSQNIHLQFSDRGLELETRDEAFGLMVIRDLEINDADTIQIEWGVDHYPEGADWENKINREAIMVYLFFGEPVAADKFYLPSTPYFIGFFLQEQPPSKEPKIGKNYKKTGRYLAIDSPSPGETIVSTFAFRQPFKAWFGLDDVPPITGIAIETDTTDLPTGVAQSFIASINLLTLN
ncbi:MAG: DUF3047 domain-containing protein [Desulfobulbaceae bacterium]|nr:MAG: DUF3047 domain-containing protein [Desulfobulbaceae bacterium]